MSKKFLLALFIILLAFPAQAADRPADPAANVRPRVGIAAVVNDEAITFADVHNRMRLYLLGAPGTPPKEAIAKMEKDVLSRLIDERLQMQEAKTLGIKVEDAQVESGFAQVASQNKLPADVFQQKLGAAGVKVGTLRDKIRAEIAWNLVIRRKLRPQINISESEIDTELARLSRGKGKPEFHVAEILITIASAETESIARQDAEKILQKLTEGASFSQVARQYSQAPGAAQGGDLGWILEGQIDPALDAALHKMEPGQVSPPVKTARGYHILFLRDKRVAGGPAPAPAAAQQPAEPMPAPIVQKPAAAPATTVVKSDDTVHLTQLIIPIAKTDPQPVVAAKISRAESLKTEVHSCDDMRAKAKDFLTPGTGDLGRGKVSELPEFVRKAVENLPEGELSLPVRTPEGVAVLMVCEREKGEETVVAAAPAPQAAVAQAQTQAEAQAPAQAPAPAPAAAAAGPAADPATDASRDQVANRLGMQRLEQMAERYLKDLRATAYIEKRI